MSPVPTSGHHQAVPAGNPPARHADAASSARPGLGRLLAGVGVAIFMLVLGMIAKTGPVARFDLRVDEHIAAHDRTSGLTTLAKAATAIGTPETIGLGLMLGLPLLLLLVRRRSDAVKVFCMFAGAFALAEIGKKLIGEHRPPVSLQAMAADSGASYPSGHATTATVLAVALAIIAGATAWRYAVIILGGLYVIAVAGSRVYLADHYLLDVLGGMLCAMAAAFVVTGLAALPVVQPYLRRLDSRGGRHRPAAMPGRRPG